MQVVFAFIFDYLILDRSIKTSSIIGGSLIITGVLIITLSRAVNATPATQKGGSSSSRHRVIVVPQSQQQGALAMHDDKQEPLLHPAGSLE